jgi:hypothetical protein
METDEIVDSDTDEKKISEEDDCGVTERINGV